MRKIRSLALLVLYLVEELAAELATLGVIALPSLLNQPKVPSR